MNAAMIRSYEHVSTDYFLALIILVVYFISIGTTQQAERRNQAVS